MRAERSTSAERDYVFMRIRYVGKYCNLHHSNISGEENPEASLLKLNKIHMLNESLEPTKRGKNSDGKGE